MVHKGQRGARKWIHNKADITGTFMVLFMALHLADTLVKHGQANPYTDIQDKKTTRCGFSLASGSASGKAFFPYTRKVFASKWAVGGFSL